MGVKWASLLRLFGCMRGKCSRGSFTCRGAACFTVTSSSTTFSSRKISKTSPFAISVLQIGRTKPLSHRTWCHATTAPRKFASVSSTRLPWTCGQWACASLSSTRASSCSQVATTMRCSSNSWCCPTPLPCTSRAHRRSPLHAMVWELHRELF